MIGKEGGRSLHYRSTSRTIFNIANYTLFVAFSLSILIPFLNAISISLSGFQFVSQGRVGIWPIGFNLESYKILAANAQFLRSIVNSVFLTVINTALVILIALAAGYALANKHLIGKKTVFLFILIPMYFNGGLIPTYLLVHKLGLTNTFGALILPAIVNIFYIIVFRNSIEQLPQELIESAEIDGASESRTLFSVILPLVLPMAMAFTVFSAVAYWNEWFGVLIYIRDKSMWTLQFQLREILANPNIMDPGTLDQLANRNAYVHPENLKMAALMLTILPVLAIYPFVQKFFIHGQIVGAVKG